MKLLDCVMSIILAPVFIAMSLMGCAFWGSDRSRPPKNHYTTLRWSDSVGPNTRAVYSYLVEKSEEEILRSCLGSAVHYPDNCDRSVVSEGFCCTAKNVLFFRAFTLEIDGEAWEFCKVRNKWHSHFAMSDKVAEAKLHELLEQILRKQPERIRNPLGGEKGSIWARPLCYD